MLVQTPATLTTYVLPSSPSDVSDVQAQHNFGLIDRKYPTDGKFDPHGTKSQWQRFARLLKALNHCRDRESVRYKILFMGRHGQGYHNVAETYYGTPAWNVRAGLLASV